MEVEPAIHAENAQLNTWSLQPGTAFPAGLTLKSDGSFTGIPTQYNTLPPPYGFFGSDLSVQVTDSSTPPLMAVDSSELDILSGLKIVSIPLPPGTAGVPYQAPPPVASGGLPPYKWQIITGQAPQLFYEYGSNPAIGALYSVGSGPVSVGTFTLQYTVTDSEAYPATSPELDGTLTVVPLSVTSATVLTSSNSVAGTGMSVTLTATVTATGSVPAGNVTFYNGTTSLETATLDATGSASIATTFSAPGVYTLTAQYSGEGAVTGSVSAPITETVVTPTISASANPDSLTVASGSSGTLTLTLTPTGGYTGSVSLSCGILPAHVSCAFAPPSLNITSGSGPVTDTLTISTAAQTAALLSEPKYGMKTPAVFAGTIFWFPASLLAFVGLGGRRKRRLLTRRLFLLAFLCLGLVGTSILSGCGTASNTTPPGAYTIPINITLPGGTVQTVNASVTVR